MDTPTFKIESEWVVDFCRVLEASKCKYKDTALIPNALLTFAFPHIPLGLIEPQITFNYFVEKSYSADITIRCYALANKIPGDNYAFFETLPRDIFYFGPGENAVLIDEFESSFVGSRGIQLNNYPSIIAYILQYKTLTLFWTSTQIGDPSVRIASPQSPISNHRPSMIISYTGDPLPAQLVVHNGDIKFSPFNPLPGNLISAEVVIYNYGATDASEVDVELWDGSPFNSGHLIGTQIIHNIPAGGAGMATFDWLGYGSPCRHTIYAVAGRNFTAPEILNRYHIAYRELLVRNDFSLFTTNFEGMERNEWMEKDDNLLSIQFQPLEEYEPHPPQIPSFTGITLTDEDNHTPEGQKCLEFFLNGAHDCGSKWIWRTIPVDIPPNVSKEIQISLWAKHKKGSQMQGGSAVLAFCDRYIPEVESDFSIIGEISGGPRWHHYFHATQITGEFKGEIYVGVGIRVRSTSDEMREFLDDIEIRIVEINQP